MPKLILLGTASAVADEDHENTHMVIVGQDGAVLIDCVASPRIRLGRAGIVLDDIGDLIVTHFHPDHVSGVPLLLMNMWLSGRRKPLRIYGLHHCLERLEDMMGFYHWEKWPRFFPVAFHRLPEQERVLVLEKDGYRILASPVRHLVPTIGLRIESDQAEGVKVVAYSCDTEPTPSVVHLASGADVLLHESSG
ncbi:MAG TPA: MBL fold metallo-hydrolase, partial [Anaerolineales bacterium]|nr:MBL fold metallo-hydrolase [Anaerolineales bacterium]